MNKIKIVDSIMGSGKTSAAINMMNSEEYKDKNFIFITPYLNEIERIKKSCTSRKFYDPNFNNKNDEYGHTKFGDLHRLLSENKNIATTHSLFRKATETTRDLIYSGNYILILDEVMDVVEQLLLKKDDLKALYDLNLVYEKDNLLMWNEEKTDFDTRYNDIKIMAMNKNLMVFKDNILIWTFPIDIFNSFKDVYILTYLFDAQFQKYYYDMYNTEYEHYIAIKQNDEYVFKQKSNNDYSELKQLLKSKINIIKDDINTIGDKDYSLSSTWYQKQNSYMLRRLKNNTENFFKNKVKSSSEDAMWTTFLDYQSKIKGRGYSKGFVSCNVRATNDYADKKNLAYTINKYMNPVIEEFFVSKNTKIDEDNYALNEMLQWIWRSRIRRYKDINIYIPSKRMRNLLINWLDNKIV